MHSNRCHFEKFGLNLLFLDFFFFFFFEIANAIGTRSLSMNKLKELIVVKLAISTQKHVTYYIIC